MQNITQFTNQYAISKSLKFELKPVGLTEENIQKDQILVQDNQKAESYKKVKVIIDDFHRDFIEKSLSGFEADWQPLAKAIVEIKNADKDNKATLQEELEAIQTTHRKDIVSHIKSNTTEDYKFTDITKAPLVKTILKKWLIDNDKGDEIELLGEFKSFDGYFTGLHETRKNIYSDESQTTALAYRIVHDNFAKFLDNFSIYEKHFSKIKSHTEWGGLAENFDKLGEEINNKNPQELIVYLNDFFQQGIDAFNQCLNQSGIDTFNNNIVAAVNLFFNSYRQQKNLKAKDLPFMKVLFKQILSKSDKGEYIESLKNDGEVINIIDNYQQNLAENDTLDKLKNIVNKLKDGEYDLDKIYWQHDQITSLSNALFDDWNFINTALNSHYEIDNGKSKNDTQKKKQEKWLKQNFSLTFLQQTIDTYIINVKIDEDKQSNILDYLTTQTNDLFNIDASDYQKISQQLADKDTKDLLQASATKKVETIKNILDNYQEIVWLFKPLTIKKAKKDDEKADITNQDEAFYGDLDKPYQQLLDIICVYNLVRNYITQKPYSVDKIKLNFTNPTLAAGWDINKETDNTSVILESNGLYYLAIMHSKHRKIFQQKPKKIEGERYQKLNYKLLSGANKMLPKVFFSKKGVEIFSPSQEILDLYKNAEHKKGDTFSINSCHKLIDFFKANINKYKVNPDDEYGWGVFGFKFSPTNNYADISQFYKEVEQQGYKTWFSDISKTYIDDCIAQGKLYLFQLYNKDFSPNSKGKKNLHTLYWQALFSKQNMADTIFKLNGKAELFYRPASIKYSDNIWNKGHHANDAKKKQKYAIIKDRRFAQDKYFFHVPITINFKTKEVFNFNKKAQTFLKDNADINIIGIDRGEKNLAYYSVINQQGKIIDQASFNTINNVDYHKLLSEVESKRDEERKSWKTISKIKDLKAGYISQVVHKITQLMVKHNAIVVMEDLNFGFKKGRIKIEKQVYQNLEKALINKLNYLSFKDYEADEAGSIAHGLQLAAPFDSFAKMSKQTGFIFYVSAPYTSKIDFKTGFAPFKYFKHETVKESKALMQGIKSITQQNNCFIIDIDYEKIPKSQSTPKTNWKLYLDEQERYQWQHKERQNQAVNVYQVLKKCFEDNGISLDGNIADNIIQANKAKVYELLFKYLNLVSQMRFTSDKGEDYILSPIRDTQGNSFRTDLASDTIPKDSDANGAYHIALKGLYMLHDRINNENTDLFIKNQQWFEYAQKMADKR